MKLRIGDQSVRELLSQGMSTFGSFDFWALLGSKEIQSTTELGLFVVEEAVLETWVVGESALSCTKLSRDGRGDVGKMFGEHVSSRRWL